MHVKIGYFGCLHCFIQLSGKLMKKYKVYSSSISNRVSIILLSYTRLLYIIDLNCKKYPQLGSISSTLQRPSKSSRAGNQYHPCKEHIIRNHALWLTTARTLPSVWLQTVTLTFLHAMLPSHA